MKKKKKVWYETYLLASGYVILPGVGHSNLLQYSCLENPMDRGAWQATIHGITKSRTWRKWLSMHIIAKAHETHKEKLMRLTKSSSWWPFWSVLMDERAAFTTELKGCNLWKQLTVHEKAISTSKVGLTFGVQPWGSHLSVRARWRQCPQGQVQEGALGIRRVMTGRLAAAQEVQSPLAAWQGVWIRRDTVSLGRRSATVTEKQRMCLSLS